MWTMSGLKVWRQKCFEILFPSRKYFELSLLCTCSHPCDCDDQDHTEELRNAKWLNECHYTGWMHLNVKISNCTTSSMLRHNVTDRHTSTAIFSLRWVLCLTFYVYCVKNRRGRDVYNVDIWTWLAGCLFSIVIIKFSLNKIIQIIKKAYLLGYENSFDTVLHLLCPPISVWPDPHSPGSPRSPGTCTCKTVI